MAGSRGGGSAAALVSFPALEVRRESRVRPATYDCIAKNFLDELRRSREIAGQIRIKKQVYPNCWSKRGVNVERWLVKYWLAGGRPAQASYGWPCR